MSELPKALAVLLRAVASSTSTDELKDLRELARAHRGFVPSELDTAISRRLQELKGS